mmetsp:Transcript_7456/g.17825  ORF Transcript_7456/g.17825 Transcript_7456/m.17825 type:complete len:249 (+) Transcript_7456:1994-2740(+)
MRPRPRSPRRDAAAKFPILSPKLGLLRKPFAFFSISSSRRGSFVKTEQLRLIFFFLLSTTGMCSFIRKSCFLLMRSASEKVAAAAAADFWPLEPLVITTSMLPFSMTKNSWPRSPKVAAAFPAGMHRSSEWDTTSFMASSPSSVSSTKALKLGLCFMARMMNSCCFSVILPPNEAFFLGDRGVVGAKVAADALPPISMAGRFGKWRQDLSPDSSKTCFDMESVTRSSGPAAMTVAMCLCSVTMARPPM